jgi:hypothetical protein
MVPVLRVRIPPPKQANAGNGQTSKDDGIANILRRTQTVKAAEQLNPAEIDVDDDLNDEINF